MHYTVNQVFFFVRAIFERKAEKMKKKLENLS